MKASIYFAIVGVLFFFLFSYMHEQVHVQIAETYGLKAKVEYFKDFPSFTTYTDKPCPTDSCRLADNINEAISYPLMIFFGLLIVFGTIVIGEIEK